MIIREGDKEDPNNPEFNVPERLKTLFYAGDFGRYANEKGELPVCFITNNDITGGNSGSPVMNAKGHLIGLAFDGNSEAMSGDIDFEENMQRCINLDVRYMLFIIDKFAGAKNLIDITLKVLPAEAIITVADRGPGIPESEASRMLQPFTRMEEARTNTRGAGLGLAIIDHIARAHNGRIELLPREGGGLRAVLHISRKMPRASTSAATDKTAAKAKPRPPATAHAAPANKTA